MRQRAPVDVGPRTCTGAIRMTISLMTISEVAERLAVSPRTVRNLIGLGPAHDGLAAVKIGRSTRVTTTELERFILGLTHINSSRPVEVVAAPAITQTQPRVVPLPRPRKASQSLIPSRLPVGSLSASRVTS